MTRYLLVIFGVLACSEPPAPSYKYVRRVEPALVYIAGGMFRGDRLACDGLHSAERSVPLQADAFVIDRKLVSCDAYAECADAGKCKPLELCAESWAVVKAESAERYCAFVGGRLPTHLQHQRAIRGIDGRTYPNGADRPAECRHRTSRDREFPRCRYESPDGVEHVLMAEVRYEHLGDRDCIPHEPADSIYSGETRAYAYLGTERLDEYVALRNDGMYSKGGYFRCVYAAKR